MTTTMSIQRHSVDDAQTIISRLKELSFNDLHPLFREGNIPTYEEVEGDIAGSFLAWNPETGRTLKLLTNIGFNNPLARWTGKNFINRFDDNTKGKGLNLG